MVAVESQKRDSPCAGWMDAVWPQADLECVDACPVCGSVERSQLHDQLKDWTFHCAPGQWSLWRCAGCAAAYLDPRPTRASIGRAYASYYTHQAPAASATYASLGTLRRLRRRLANGYVGWRYGAATAEPSSRAGVLVAFALPPLKTQLDHKYRHLPVLGASSRSLLDVGCGDGSFLALARDSGWQTLGIDFDEQAVGQARQRGLAVLQGGIDILVGRHDEFDVITLSHVLEHMHDPFAVLAACHRLLKPDGQMWLETPNIDSYSHTRFGRFWRGLETPRHLVLFTDGSLSQLLNRAGFVSIERVPRPSAFRSLYASSQTIQSNIKGEQVASGARLKVEAAFSTLCAMVRPAHREHLTITARKRSTDTPWKGA